MNPYFILLVLKQVNVVAAVTISMIHMQKCVPDAVKDLNVKEFNLMSRTNEARHIKWHETCKFKYRLDAVFVTKKKRWNYDKYRCKCWELIDKGVCTEGFIWNPSNWECEFDKSCDVGEFLDYKNCKCKKELADKLVEECTENIDEVKIASENEHKNKCSSCILYIVLLLIKFAINIWIGAYFVYLHWYLKKMFRVLSLILTLKQ